MTLGALFGVVFILFYLFSNLGDLSEGKEKTNGILGGITMIFVLIGFLFKIQHWPAANVLIYIGGVKQGNPLPYLHKIWVDRHSPCFICLHRSTMNFCFCHVKKKKMAPSFMTKVTSKLLKRQRILWTIMSASNEDRTNSATFIKMKLEFHRFSSYRLELKDCNYALGPVQKFT